MNRIRDSSTPDSTFKLNSAERQTLCSLRGKTISRTLPASRTLAFLKIIPMIREWKVTHEQECRTQEVIFFHNTKYYHRCGRLLPGSIPELTSCFLKNVLKTTETDTDTLKSAKPSAETNTFIKLSYKVFYSPTNYRAVLYFKGEIGYTTYSSWSLKVSHIFFHKITELKGLKGTSRDLEIIKC